jgi:hypothetical protein
MIYAKYVKDGSSCSTAAYSNDPEKYRGLIICFECEKKTWFTKGFTTEKFERMACFSAHHEEGCNVSTVQLTPKDSDYEEGHESELPSTDIRVDLDRSNGQSIYVSQENDKHGNEDSDWISSSQNKAIGGSNGFPLNKSLRQLLTHLCKNPNYADRGQSITIVADSGRKIIDGELKDYLVPIERIVSDQLAKSRIFWGTINNLNEDKNGQLWLNYGDYRSEPSILLDKKQKVELLKNFKIKEVSELDGSDVIIVSHAGRSPSGKIIIKASFTKYMSFRRYNSIALKD